MVIMRKTDPRSLKDAILGDLKVMGIESMNAFRDGFIKGMNGHYYQNGLWYNIQTQLEKEAMVLRAQQTSKSDYGPSNEYNALHPDAIADGNEKGKGSGESGVLRDKKPDRSLSTYINIDNPYDTSKGGNNCDNAGRNNMTAHSLYSPSRQYYNGDGGGLQSNSQNKIKNKFTWGNVNIGS